MENLKKKGTNCSKEGKKYEEIIYNIVKYCYLDGIKFNTQSINELAGCSSSNDIICDFNNIKIPMEIKKCKTPDWMQCSLNYDPINNKWIGSSKNKIPDNSKKIFENLISNKILFNGQIPPFIDEKITYEEWIKIKEKNDNFKDVYISHNLTDTIKNLYKEKGCYYIQISEKGLYHLGYDICCFNVPEFICDQQLRIRIKVHKTKNKKGFCDLSITAACQPININNLEYSKYSLDDIKKLPKNLTYSKYSLDDIDKLPKNLTYSKYSLDDIIIDLNFINNLDSLIEDLNDLKFDRVFRSYENLEIQISKNIIII